MDERIALCYVPYGVEAILTTGVKHWMPEGSRLRIECHSMSLKALLEGKAKLLLLPLSVETINNLFHNDNVWIDTYWYDAPIESPEDLPYFRFMQLVSKGVDLFDLIENDLAVDKNTIKQS